MKYQLISLLLFTPFLFFSQFTAIPDSSFEEALIDLGKDDKIDGGIYKADTITILDDLCCPNSLKGIENFTNLKFLSSPFGSLKEIDLSKNTKLKVLDLFNNNLQKLNLSFCKELEFIQISKNNLKSIDLSNCKNLQFLYAHSCQLDSLIISKNQELVYLQCDNNNLKELDISKNLKLIELWLPFSGIIQIDVTKNKKLEYINSGGMFINKEGQLIDSTLIQLGFNYKGSGIFTREE